MKEVVNGCMFWHSCKILAMVRFLKTYFVAVRLLKIFWTNSIVFCCNTEGFARFNQCIYNIISNNYIVKDRFVFKSSVFVAPWKCVA